MTFLALDFGARRLGLALSDDAGRLGFPLQTLTRKPNDLRGDIAALLDLMRARGVEAVVLGIPGGSAQSDEMAQSARAFVQKLKIAALAVNLNLEWLETDERFSTAQAHGALRAAGVSTRASRDAGGAGSIDARSAAIFLQTFLDARNAQSNPELDDDSPGDDDLGTLSAP